MIFPMQDLKASYKHHELLFYLLVMTISFKLK